MKKIICLTVLTAFAFACKKKDDNNPVPSSSTTRPAPASTNEFAMLKSGNYWVYEMYSVDTNGVSTKNPYRPTDTVYARDTFRLRGRLFCSFISRDPVLTSGLSGDGLADSAGYLINNQGTRLFSSFDFTNTLSTYTYGGSGSVVFSVSNKMTDSTLSVTVPAGTFKVYRATNTIILPHYPIHYYHELRVNYYDFARGIGLVRYRMFEYSNPSYVEGRLVYYHVVK